MQRVISFSGSIVVFDGVCNLCNAWVNFVIVRDRGGKFRFAALQSAAGQRLVGDLRHGGRLDGSSIVLIEGKHYHTRSTAALRIARGLDFPWPLLYGLVLVPRFFRNWIYDLVAQNRYRLFGKRETCRVATPEVEDRFLV